MSGSYEPLAQGIFRNIHAERLMLEYDDERSGDFSPLAHIPEDKTALLGLVTTNGSRLETVENLQQRIHEAALYVPLERLAVSSQCGFATSVVGNALSEGDQERKLKLLAQTTEAVWGG